MNRCVLWGIRTSSISAGGSLPGKGEARCSTPETPAKQSVSNRLCGPFAPTFEGLGEISANDIINTNDIHAVSSGLGSKGILHSGDFGGAGGSEDRHPSSAWKQKCPGATKRTYPRTR